MKLVQPLLEEAVIEKLSQVEAVDRYCLEQKVELAFSEAGVALRELRDRRLYRDSHKTFEDYCLDRFGYNRRHAYRLIDAAEVVGNLCPIRTQNSEVGGNLCPIRTQNSESDDFGQNDFQILPTNEYQVRPLAKLKSEQQLTAWQKAVERMGNKAPSGKVVQEIVDEIVETNPSATKSGKRTSKSKKKSSNSKPLALVPNLKSQSEQMLPDTDLNATVTPTTGALTADALDNIANEQKELSAELLNSLGIEPLEHITNHDIRLWIAITPHVQADSLLLQRWSDTDMKWMADQLRQIALEMETQLEQR